MFKINKEEKAQKITVKLDNFFPPCLLLMYKIYKTQETFSFPQQRSCCTHSREREETKDAAGSPHLVRQFKKTHNQHQRNQENKKKGTP